MTISAILVKCFSVFCSVHVSFAFIILSETDERRAAVACDSPFFCCRVVFSFSFPFFSVRVSVPASKQIVRSCVMFINLCPEIFKAAFRNSSFGVLPLAGLGAVLRAGDEKKKNWCTEKKLEKSLLAHDWSLAERPHLNIRLCRNFPFFIICSCCCHRLLSCHCTELLTAVWHFYTAVVSIHSIHPQSTLFTCFEKTPITISHLILETKGSRKHTLCSFSTQPDLFILYIL